MAWQLSTLAVFPENLGSFHRTHNDLYLQYQGLQGHQVPMQYTGTHAVKIPTHTHKKKYKFSKIVSSKALHFLLN